MRIPEKIKIGWKDYEVEVIKETGKMKDGGDELYGRIDLGKREITINKAYDDDQQKCTLVHECIHGVDELFGIGLKEEQVEQLGHGIYMLIKDNEEAFEKGGEKDDSMEKEKRK